MKVKPYMSASEHNSCLRVSGARAKVSSVRRAQISDTQVDHSRVHTSKTLIANCSVRLAPCFTEPPTCSCWLKRRAALHRLYAGVWALGYKQLVTSRLRQTVYIRPKPTC